MNSVYISVIIPTVSDESAFPGFCRALFASKLNMELIVCGSVDEKYLAEIPAEYGERIKFFGGRSALGNAVSQAMGVYLTFSDVGVVYSPDAFETLILKSEGRACACNCSASSQGRLFRDGFAFDELSEKPAYFCHLLRKSVIGKAGISPVGTDSLSLMLFLADYYRYDECTPVNETLLNCSGELDYTVSEQSLAAVSDYGSVFAATGNDKASSFYLRAAVNALDGEENFSALKAAAVPYAENYALTAWMSAAFNLDVKALSEPDMNYADFCSRSRFMKYREVEMPLLPDDITADFYSGRLGADVLKRCICAWLYFKLYRRKDGFVKRVGCKLCKRLLGGDFNA